MPLTLLGSLSPRELADRLASGLTVTTGPFRFRLQSSMPAIVEGLRTLYGDFPIDDDQGFRDFHVRVDRVDGPRRWIRPQVNFWHDGSTPFKPLPADHAFALLEWGMNWCIAGHSHHYLMLHAAVLERNGQCVVLPGEPGAGKSTLTAALSQSGWRLLSDEITLIDRDDGLIAPLARPISLKNQSIGLIQAFRPTATFGKPARDTHKGTVAHLRPESDSVRRMNNKGVARHIVLPIWKQGAQTRLTGRGKADTFMQTATHSFNYSLLGAAGFELNANLVDASECWDFCYSMLDDAIDVFNSLTA